MGTLRFEVGRLRRPLGKTSRILFYLRAPLGASSYLKAP